MRRAWVRVAVLAVVLVVAATLNAEAAGTKTGSAVGLWGFRVERAVVRDHTQPRNNLTLVGNWSRASGKNGSPAVAFGGRSIARTPNRPELNPGRRTFGVAIAFRFPRGMNALTGTDSPNLVQKGLFGSPGQWKLEILKYTGGHVQCRMFGSRRKVDVVSPTPDIVRDRAWHQAACLRTDHKVVLVVDGRRTVRNVGVGTVSNDNPMTVANKYRSAGTDQFHGLVDSLAISRGRRALATVLNATS